MIQKHLRPRTNSKNFNLEIMSPENNKLTLKKKLISIKYYNKNKSIIKQNRKKNYSKIKKINDIQKNIIKYKHRNKFAKKNLANIHHKQILKFNTTIRLNQDKIKSNKIIDFPILNNGNFII